MMARATQCLEDSEMAAKIERACQEVCCYLQMHGQNQQRYFTEYIHPQPLPWGWQTEWIQNDQTVWVLQFMKVRVSEDPRGCPGGSLIHDLWEEAILGFIRDSPKSVALS